MDKTREIELVELCKNGDRLAMGTLVRNYERQVYNAAYRMLGNPDDAADVTQTAFLKAFEGITRFNPKYKFFSWIYRITINEAIDQLNRRGRSEPLGETEPESDQADPGQMAVSGEAGARLQAVIMQLPENHRSVLVLRYYNECNYQQISEILQIPEKTVKSRLFSARQQLKDRLSTLEPHSNG